MPWRSFSPQLFALLLLSACGLTGANYVKWNPVGESDGGLLKISVDDTTAACRWSLPPETSICNDAMGANPPILRYANHDFEKTYWLNATAMTVRQSFWYCQSQWCLKE